MRDRQTATKVLIIVTPNFNLAATVGVLDTFRAANYLGDQSLYDWDIASESGGAQIASNKLSVDSTALSDLGQRVFDIVLVSSSWAPEKHASVGLITFLRAQYNHGAILGGLDTGGSVLAHAGFLNGKTATVHYEHLEAFKEMFPNVQASDDICVFEDRFITCCGGVAAVDFGLTIIRGTHGDALANASARYLFKGSLRPSETRQSAEAIEPIGVSVPPVLKNAIRMMEANLEQTIPIRELCDRVQVSHRQLSRLFTQYVRKSPSTYYRDIRLDRARGLVTQTQMPIAEVALASGFNTHVHFSRVYKERFGRPPIQDRIDGRVPFEFRARPVFTKLQ